MNFWFCFIFLPFPCLPPAHLVANARFLPRLVSMVGHGLPDGVLAPAASYLHFTFCQLSICSPHPALQRQHFSPAFPHPKLPAPPPLPPRTIPPSCRYCNIRSSRSDSNRNSLYILAGTRSSGLGLGDSLNTLAHAPGLSLCNIRNHARVHGLLLGNRAGGASSRVHCA